ncbi:MAG: acyltransferase family protein [Propioniciclava sp.]
MVGNRNQVIDVARAASIIVVVVYHGLLYRIHLTDGRVRIEPWAAPAMLYPLTWLLMVMPLFFVAGGYVHARLVDRLAAQDGSYPSFLTARARRLLGPLGLFVTVSAVVSTLAALFGSTPAVAALSQRFMTLLWFLAVYLMIIAAAPAMVRAHDRAGGATFLGLLIASLSIDGYVIQTGRIGLLEVNYLLVWLLVHQLGIAYHRGWFRRGAAWIPWAAVIAGTAAILFLIFRLDYPPSAVGFADLPLANAQPPTTAMAALALAQCGILGLAERSGRFGTPSARTAARLAGINAFMVTTYLWHLLGIVLAAGALVMVAWLLPSAAPVVLHQITVASFGLAVTALMVPWIARLEVRLIPAAGLRPSPTGPSTTGLVASYAVLVAGVIAVWHTGAVVLPSSPDSLAAVLLLGLGSLGLRRSLGRRPRPRSVAQ